MKINETLKNAPRLARSSAAPGRGRRRHGSVLRSVVAASVLACGAMIGTSAQAALSFQFDFQGDFTAVQQQGVIDAGALFSQMFATHFTNTATLRFNVISKDVGLASAATNETGAAGFGNTEVVRNKAINGVDLNGPTADGFININLATNFQYDPNAPVDFDGGQIDLYSLINHELTHALGFVSFVAPTSSGDFTKFDQFLTSNAGVAFVDPITGLVNQAALADATANGALFAGPNAIARYGAPVPIQGPDGALSHLGTTAFSFPTSSQNALMLCCGGLVNSFEPRDYNAAEIGIMADLGYTLTPVPEPTTYALMIAGIALVGYATKRRNG